MELPESVYVEEEATTLTLRISVCTIEYSIHFSPNGVTMTIMHEVFKHRV